MELDIVSYERVGPIMFGMHAELVRRVVGGKYREFRRTPQSQQTTDAFESVGIFVCYAVDKTCSAVEMGSLSSPTFLGREVIGKRFIEVHEWLKQLDNCLEVDDTGLTAFLLGIGIYAPRIKKDPGAIVEGVIAFKKGYYGRV